MKASGFPCRFGGCDLVIYVPERDSVPALLAASAKRTEHEVAAHAYTHPPYQETHALPWTAQGATKKKTPRP